MVLSGQRGERTTVVGSPAGRPGPLRVVGILDPLEFLLQIFGESPEAVHNNFRVDIQGRAARRSGKMECAHHFGGDSGEDGLGTRIRRDGWQRTSCCSRTAPGTRAAFFPMRAARTCTSCTGRPGTVPAPVSIRGSRSPFTCMASVHRRRGRSRAKSDRHGNRCLVAAWRAASSTDTRPSSRSAAELSWTGGADSFRAGQRDVASLYADAIRDEGHGDWATYQLRRMFRKCRQRSMRKLRQKPAIASMQVRPLFAPQSWKPIGVSRLNLLSL
jgi:hypothetical protein